MTMRTAQQFTRLSEKLLPLLMQPSSKLKATSSPRNIQRLNRLDSPHANAWLSARPSCMDGTDTVLDVSTLLPPLISGRLRPASHTLKVRKSTAFVHSDYDFAPVIFETSGALNKEVDCPQADY